jgi:hypothetical protein
LTLETYDETSQLYLAVGDDVSAFRPVFAGDVYQDIEVPGTPGLSMAIVTAHPCTFRVQDGELTDRVLVAVVRPHPEIPKQAWPGHHFSKMPLPELAPGEFHVAHLDEVGRASSTELTNEKRTACLSEFGINLLQQRMVWHATRCAIETATFFEAFGHTYEEADLLEEWCEALADIQIPVSEARARFEAVLRSPQDGGRTLQDQLKDPQLRSGVRTACRAEARRQRSGEAEPALSQPLPAAGAAGSSGNRPDS